MISHANKGKAFEQEVELANTAYQRRGMALVQKISTPTTVVRRGKQIVSAFYSGKSTLDFRGTIKGGRSISFDCKESEVLGLPLSYIKPHQIEYIRQALAVGEISFILCYVKPLNKRFFIAGDKVLSYWDRWQANKGRRGFNTIPIESMIEVKARDGIILDYLEAI